MRLKKWIAAALTMILLSGSSAVFAQTSGNTTADVTFLSGTASITSMSSISFGTQTIIATQMDYNAQEEIIELNVLDLRGTGKGWAVTAVASTFESEGQVTLRGASIFLRNGIAVSANEFSGTPSVGDEIVLECDGESSAEIAEAALGEGLGAWAIRWSGAASNNTVLRVPGGIATTGVHTTTITWTLTLAP